MSRAEMRDAILKEALKSLPTDETEAKKILLKAVYAARRIEVPRTELIGVQYREFDNYSWASPFSAAICGGRRRGDYPRSCGA